MKHRILHIFLFIIYIVGMTALMIWQGVGIAPDRYAFVLLLASLLIKKTRSFILYVLACWFFLVYLGEHYAVDIITGAFYALVYF